MDLFTGDLKIEMLFLSFFVVKHYIWIDEINKL